MWSTWKEQKSKSRPGSIRKSKAQRLYLPRTWRPHHSTKNPQNKGRPPPPPPSSTKSKAKPKRMKMGMGGALNGITNSILTNNDNRSIYIYIWLIIHEKNEPICLGITRKPFCERSPNSEGGFVSHNITWFSRFQWSKLS